MLIEFQVILVVFSLIVFLLAFFNNGIVNSEILWGISIVLFATIMYSSLDVTMMLPVYNETTSVYAIQPVSTQNWVYTGLGFLFFSLSILGFYVDVFQKYGKKDASETL